MSIFESIRALTNYALRTGLISPEDETYTINRLLGAMKENSFEEPAEIPEKPLHEILASLCDEAQKRGIIGDTPTERDLFDTELMGILTPRPSEVIARFRRFYAESPERATDDYYAFSKATNYIRADRIARDVKWVTPTPYGDIDITINLSKPEKDPRAIAAAKLQAASGYPKCQLCPENEGYAGRLDHPARANHRVIPVQVDGMDWRFQYSPYVYYNEHCIVFDSRHVPMAINDRTFRKLLDFVRQFPHYFVGSNADLPIVGGSILTHDHFQGGRYRFAMEKAPIETPIVFKGFESVEAGIVRWPMSVIRIRHEETEPLCALASKILACWRGYTDESAVIFAETSGVPHNTVTPIARKAADGKFELDLVLRNNLTTPEHPMGLYHPHAELHHVKKENIGLIEVMGLAVLPARLKNELEILADYLVKGLDPAGNEQIAKHADWVKELRQKYAFTAENVMSILRDEVGKVFATVLEHAGVYKRNEAGKEAFLRFAAYVNEK